MALTVVAVLKNFPAMKTFGSEWTPAPAEGHWLFKGIKQCVRLRLSISIDIRNHYANSQLTTFVIFIRLDPQNFDAVVPGNSDHRPTGNRDKVRRCCLCVLAIDACDTTI